MHYFVAGSIAELALAKVARTPGDPMEVFWNEVMGLRDLLKFEFFFPGKEEFRIEVGQELTQRFPGWEELVSQGTDGVCHLLAELKPIHSGWAIRPFLEAYFVAAETLTLFPAADDLDEKAFLSRALELGTQYRLQERIEAEEAVSQVLFKSALRLAENRGLLTTDERGDVDERRA